MSLPRALIVGAASLLTLATLTSCAPTAAPANTRNLTHDWSFGSVEEGVRHLSDSERSLDVVIASELGIDEALEVSPAEAADWLPRVGGTTTPLADGGAQDPRSCVPVSTGRGAGGNMVAAAYPIPQPDMETVGAAANGLSLIHALLRDALGEASSNSSTRSASRAPAEGDNPSISWSVDKGMATGAFTSSISDTNDAGDAVTVALEGQFEIMVCPDPDGIAEGAFLSTAAVTFTPHGGTAKRTSVDLDMETIAHVTDRAYSDDLWARVDAAVRTGAPEAGSDTRVHEPEGFRREENAWTPCSSA